MTLPASGAISMTDVANELGRGGSVIALGEYDVRHLALRRTDPISLTDLYGKNGASQSAWVQLGSGNVRFAHGAANCDVRPKTIGGHVIAYFGQVGANFVIETDGGLSATAFSSLTINGVTLTTASATFHDDGIFGVSSWTWPGAAASVALVADGIYPMSLT